MTINYRGIDIMRIEAEEMAQKYLMQYLQQMYSDRLDYMLGGMNENGYGLLDNYGQPAQNAEYNPVSLGAAGGFAPPAETETLYGETGG